MEEQTAHSGFSPELAGAVKIEEPAALAVGGAVNDKKSKRLMVIGVSALVMAGLLSAGVIWMWFSEMQKTSGDEPAAQIVVEISPTPEPLKDQPSLSESIEENLQPIEPTQSPTEPEIWHSPTPEVMINWPEPTAPPSTTTEYNCGGMMMVTCPYGFSCQVDPNSGDGSGVCVED